MQRPAWDTLVAETSTRFGRSRSAFTLDLQAQPTEVRRARAFVRTNLPQPASAGLDTVLVLVSELMTNAVLHGRGAAHGIVRLEMSVHEDGVILIGVSDESSALPRQRDARRDEEDGRGLQIVRELADEWGCVPLGPAGGKIVWFRVRGTKRPRIRCQPAAATGAPPVSERFSRIVESAVIRAMPAKITATRKARVQP